MHRLTHDDLYALAFIIVALLLSYALNLSAGPTIGLS